MNQAHIWSSWMMSRIFGEISSTDQQIERQRDLESIQDRCRANAMDLKVDKCMGLHDVQEIQRSLQLPTLASRRILMDMVFLQKFLDGLIDCPEVLRQVNLHVPRGSRHCQLFCKHHHPNNYHYHSTIPRLMRTGSSQKNYILDKINRFNKLSCVQWLPSVPGKPLSAKFLPNYKSECFTSQHSSFNASEVNLSERCFDEGWVMHEMGHVMGFEHEQKREDRNCYLEIDPSRELHSGKQTFTGEPDSDNRLAVIKEVELATQLVAQSMQTWKRAVHDVVGGVRPTKKQVT
ncbi:Astacin (Peptidase M12A) [Homalodisca vitripennis]|nr:Astacin (Peptidase M12A) [Homalodisca vitripennis]